jgi:tetratricopeptide (TPR) repeat protein
MLNTNGTRAHVSDAPIDWGPKQYGLIYQEASKCRDQGRSKFAEKKVQEALTQFEEAIEYIESAGDRGALKNLNKVEDWEALALSCYLNVSLCSLKLEHWLRAITSASKALDYDPKNAKALYRRAQARFRGGKGNIAELPEAKTDLTAAAHSEPQNKAVRKELKAVVEMLAKTKEQRDQAKKKARAAMQSALKDTYEDKRDGQHEMDMHIYTANAHHHDAEFKESVKSYTAALKQHKLMAQQKGVATHLGDPSTAAFWSQVLDGAADGAAKRAAAREAAGEKGADEDEDPARVQDLTDLVSALASIRSGIGGSLQRLDMLADGAEEKEEEQAKQAKQAKEAKQAEVAARLAKVGLEFDEPAYDPTTDAAWQHTESILLTQMLHEYKEQVAGGGALDVEHLCAMGSAHGNLGMLLMGRATKAKRKHANQMLALLNGTGESANGTSESAGASESAAGRAAAAARFTSSQQMLLRQARGHFEDQLQAGVQLHVGAEKQGQELERAADQALIMQARAHASVGSCMVAMVMAAENSAGAEEGEEGGEEGGEEEGEEEGEEGGEEVVRAVGGELPTVVEAAASAPSIDDALAQHRQGLYCCSRLLVDQGMPASSMAVAEAAASSGQEGEEQKQEAGKVLRVEETVPPQVKRAAMVMAVVHGRMGGACRLLSRHVRAMVHHTTQLRLADMCNHGPAADAARLGIGWSYWRAMVSS